MTRRQFVDHSTGDLEWLNVCDVCNRGPLWDEQATLCDTCTAWAWVLAEARQLAAAWRAEEDAEVIEFEDLFPWESPPPGRGLQAELDWCEAQR